MKKKGLWLIFLSALCCMFFWTRTAFASDRDYEIKRVRINADVQKNGDVIVNQAVTYAFDGKFHGVYYDQDLKGIKGVEDIGAQIANDDNPINLPVENSGKNDTLSIEKGSDKVRMKIYHEMDGGRATFVYRYTIKSLITNYQDTAELNWKVIGKGWEKPLSDVQITINLPSRPVPELKAYAHGDLSGETKVDRDQGRVVMTLENNPARTYVETRLLFPTSVTPDCLNVKNITYKEEAERKERELAKIANEKRRKERFFSYLAFGLVSVLSLAIPVTALVGPGERTKKLKNYVRSYEIPKMPPEQAYVLDKGEQPNARTYTAHLMDLAGQKRVLITPVEKRDWKISKKQRKDFNAGDLDEFLFEKVGDGQSYTMKQLKRYGKDHKNSERLHDKFEGWCSNAEVRVNVDYKSMKNVLWNERLKTYFKYNVYAVIAILIFLFLKGLFAKWQLILLGELALSAASIFYYRMTHDKYNQRGQEQRYQVRCFKKMLKEVGRFDLREVGDIVLWEKILPYAVAFGVAKRVIKELKATYGKAAVNEAFDENRAIVDDEEEYGIFEPDSYSGTLSRASSNFHSGSYSSSSGGSGGFSGGSSGGVGGGSGGGAF